MMDSERWDLNDDERKISHNFKYKRNLWKPFLYQDHTGYCEWKFKAKIKTKPRLATWKEIKPQLRFTG